MTGFNLILCYYALGDKERMQQGFVRMLSIQQVPQAPGDPAQRPVTYNQRRN